MNNARRVRLTGASGYWRWWMVLCAAWSVAAAPQEPVPESSVKAAFVYKFVSYIEWPAAVLAEGEPVTIGVVEAEEIAIQLQQIAAGRIVDGHPVRVKVLPRGASPDGIHLLFVGAAASRTHFTTRPAGHGIVTVTETNGAAPTGSVIDLVTVDGRIRFDISLPAAHRAGVKLSSRLLAVARTVDTGAP